jgi:putative transposase
LELADVRAHRWRARIRETGSLEDLPPAGAPDLSLGGAGDPGAGSRSLGWVNRSHRKLAHRGSYTGKVFAAPSTLLRVALCHKVTLPGERVRPRPVMPAFPELPWERNQIWMWDATHFTSAGRVAYATWLAAAAAPSCTSGMKAVINGGLTLSVDGWWVEAPDG